MTRSATCLSWDRHKDHLVSRGYLPNPKGVGPLAGAGHFGRKRP